MINIVLSTLVVSHLGPFAAAFVCRSSVAEFRQSKCGSVQRISHLSPSSTVLTASVEDQAKLEEDSSKAYDAILRGLSDEADSEVFDLDQPETDHDANPMEDSAETDVQYAALEPGTVVHIQVGDISLARKAWKKRRRSGSPLLVPCSVLNVDRASTVRWNLIYLLEKFGSNKSGLGNGLSISFATLNQRHRSHLKFSLQKHAVALGFETSSELIEHLFNPRAQETYGVKLAQDDEGMKWLHAPLSRLRAQKRANKAAVLQFYNDGPHDDTLKHSGIVRNKNQNRQEGDNYYRLQALSAALRVGQKEDVESGTIQDGSLHAAVVFDYDPAGDAGSPLLTLSLNPGRNQVREKLKIVDRSHKVIHDPNYDLKDLHLGDGPLKGKVMKLVRGGALVDCGVGRKIAGKKEHTEVMGFLQFKDAVVSEPASTDLEDSLALNDEDGDGEWEDILSIEDLSVVAKEDDGNDSDVLGGMDLSEFDLDGDDEFADSEDITHMFEIGADGDLVYKDSSPLDDVDVDNIEQHLDDEEEEEEDGPVIFAETQKAKKQYNQPTKRRVRVQVGDQVEAYVKSVSRQSSRLQLTLDSAIHGRKARDVKRESEVEKKLTRLDKQLGGLDRIEELKGKEMNGVVKATSNTGNWLYVEPTKDGLPVGVATIPDDAHLELSKGDSCTIRLEGVDSSRGQLSFTVVSG